MLCIQTLGNLGDGVIDIDITSDCFKLSPYKVIIPFYMNVPSILDIIYVNN